MANENAVPVREAEIKDFNGYKLPVKSIEGHIMTTTHRSVENAQKAAAKDGSIAFILHWQSEVGGNVYGLYLTDETYYTRKAAKLAAEGKDNTYALALAKESAVKPRVFDEDGQYINGGYDY